MAITILSQPPNDAFSIKMFYNMMKDYSDVADIIYIWSLMLDSNWECVKWNDVFDKYLPTGELFYRKRIKEIVKKDVVLFWIVFDLLNRFG